MEIRVCNDKAALGKSAAEFAAMLINKAIKEKGYATIVLSTGASQFDTLLHLVKQDVDWKKVEMFHLDEYVGIPEIHPASFRKYLKEKFTNLVPIEKVHFIDGTEENRKITCSEILKFNIDVGLIGIGENSHIAFNDPPADFETEEPYIVVNLDDNCKKQQVGEGWFETVYDVPKQAVSMSVKQIMKCRNIISCVPYTVKADAVLNTLKGEVSCDVPATILKTHPNFTLYIDRDSASKLSLPIMWQE